MSSRVVIAAHRKVAATMALSRATASRAAMVMVPSMGAIAARAVMVTRAIMVLRSKAEACNAATAIALVIAPADSKAAMALLRAVMAVA